MRPRSIILASLCALSLLAVSCVPYEEPSYVGTWRYESSEPDLGPGYADSYVEVDKKWNYTFYDAPTGQYFSGSGQDFAHDGLTVILTATNDSETRIYEAEMQFLKDDKMIVKTASVNGTPTVIRFYRERHNG